MSIKQIRNFIGKVNIAEDLDDDVLIEIGERVCRQFEEDDKSMEDWNKSVEEGLKLMKQEFRSNPGKSNYKDPLLTEASIAFGDKASLELLRHKDLVSFEIIGNDPDNAKKDTSKRVTQFMNYQINHDMNKWRRTQSRAFYGLANIGTLFKKTVFDPMEQKAESHVIQYPDFVVNQATRSMDTCRSFSHILPDINKNTIEARIRAGLWLDLEDTEDIQNEEDGDKGSNEAEGVIDTFDNPEKFVEQQTFYDLDEDGYEEPYIVTVHLATRKVVRMVARFDEQSIMVKKNDQIMTLPEAIDANKKQDVSLFGGQKFMSLVGLQEPQENLKGLNLVSIKPFQAITKYGIIPSPDGTFLDFGYAHLLGAITQAINSTTNQLNDAGTRANLGGGFLSKEFRKLMGTVRMQPGEYKKTDVPAEKMAKGIFPNPSPEPSPTLFALNEKMQTRGKEFLALADISGRIDAQTAPTTALAIIQEAMIPTSALFKRILDATSDEFEVLFRLNKTTLSNLKYQTVLDLPQVSVEQDFNDNTMDMVPTANAEMSSKMQRIQTAQLEIEMVPLVLQAGGNPVPIIKNYFESIGSTVLDQIFPEEGSMSPAEQQQLQKMQEAQDLSNQIQQQQLEILSREQDRLDADTQAKVQKVGKEIEKMQTEMVKNITAAMLNAEKAESEQVSNHVNLYTSGLRGQLDILTAIGAEDDRRNIAQSNALNPARNFPRAVS